MFDGTPPQVPAGVRFRALRKRAGLSMQKLALAAGYRGASSIQTIEKARELRPRTVGLFLPVLVGKGDPPITEAEVRALAGDWSDAPILRSGEPSLSRSVYNAEAYRWRLQCFLDDNNLSARALCEAANLSSSAISQLLTGRVDSLTERTYQELAHGASLLLKRSVAAAELRGP